MRKSKILALLIVFVLVVAYIGSTQVQGATKTIKIGTVLGLSGSTSGFGTYARNGIQMAVNEINGKGGVLGKKIELIAEDDENSPDKTKNALMKLVFKDKIVAFIGGLTSKCTLAVTRYAQARKLVMITPTSTNDDVTKGGNFIFRACYSDSFQGEVVAQFSYESLKAKKAAIVYDISNDYSKGLTASFTKKFQTLGGKVVATESYTSGDKDFNAQLTKIKAAAPEVLFIPDYYNTISLIAKQVRAQGITVPMVGADGWDEIIHNAGDEVLGCYYSDHYSPDANDPDVKAFVKKYIAKYKTIPNAFAALGYDAAYILADAIQNAGSTDPIKIQAAMMKTDQKFVTGHIKFNSERNPVKSAIMLKVVKDKNGKLATQYAGTVNP